MGIIHTGWADILEKIEELYNNTSHGSTKFSPCEVLFGEVAKLTVDKYPLVKNIEQIREEARVSLREAAQVRQEKYDQSHRLIEFQIGDLVKIRKLNKSDSGRNRTRKIELLYEGPYKVGARKFQNVYLLVNPETLEIKGVYNAIHLARYYN